MILTILVALIIVALVYWVITTLPLPAMIRTVAIVILVVFVVIYLLQFIGGPKVF
jgi:hypothetical protein